MLETFFMSFPRYAPVALKSTAASFVTGGAAIAASLIVDALIQSVGKAKAIEKARVNAQDLITLLNKEKEARRRVIKKYDKEIEDIKKRRLSEEHRITEIESLIEDLSQQSDSLGDKIS